MSKSPEALQLRREFPCAKPSRQLTAEDAFMREHGGLAPRLIYLAADWVALFAVATRSLLSTRRMKARIGPCIARRYNLSAVSKPRVPPSSS